ncbi:MAG: family transcriptional regulator [Paenibacillus sp.]|nr:family transcriptional regulator [Paenibacillus sp.]
MDMQQFGAYLSKLRKQNDWTQSQLADRLNVTRQAVSKWELGDSFPDISLLPQLSSIFQVTIDQLIRYGQPGHNEHSFIRHIVDDNPERAAEMLDNNAVGVDAVLHLAPVLKASTLGLIAERLAKLGIRIDHIVELSTYLHEADVAPLLLTAAFDTFDETMMRRFAPFLDDEAKAVLFTKIINNEIDRSLLVPLLRYLDQSKYASLIEAAVLEGELDAAVLTMLRDLNV